MIEINCLEGLAIRHLVIVQLGIGAVVHHQPVHTSISRTESFVSEVHLRRHSRRPDQCPHIDQRLIWAGTANRKGAVERIGAIIVNERATSRSIKVHSSRIGQRERNPVRIGTNAPTR